MRKFFQPSFISRNDSRGWSIFYTTLAVLVALAMFVAAAGSGSGSHVTEQPLPTWIDVTANVLSALIGLLVLIPRTRILGSIFAVINMLLSMIVNYTVDGIEYFALVSPFNVVTIMLASILIGHYAADLFHLIGGSNSDNQEQLALGNN